MPLWPRDAPGTHCTALLKAERRRRQAAIFICVRHMCEHTRIISYPVSTNGNLWWDGVPQNAAQWQFSPQALSWHVAAPVSCDRCGCSVNSKLHMVKSHGGTRRSRMTAHAPSSPSPASEATLLVWAESGACSLSWTTETATWVGYFDCRSGSALHSVPVTSMQLLESARTSQKA